MTFGLVATASLVTAMRSFIDGSAAWWQEWDVPLHPTVASLHPQVHPSRCVPTPRGVKSTRLFDMLVHRKLCLTRGMENRCRELLELAATFFPTRVGLRTLRVFVQ
ncbi:hypothetical protein GCM10010216_39780 [Streptomyces flaveolus]|nr:hypothetical protein GCM10010216_39780 [Streptomyces flaveolus]